MRNSDQSQAASSEGDPTRSGVDRMDPASPSGICWHRCQVAPGHTLATE